MRALGPVMPPAEQPGQSSRGRSYLRTPAALSASFIQWAESLRGAATYDWGHSQLDRTLLPFRPGSLTYLIARPGHGKTLLLAYLAKRIASTLVAEGRAQEECVVYVSLEQVVEEIDVLLQPGAKYTPEQVIRGQVSQEEVLQSALLRPKIPLWVMGDSVADTEPPDYNRRLTLERTFEEIESLEQEFGIRPAAVCIDYIQLARFGGSRAASDDQKTAQVTAACEGAKELAKSLKVPVICGVQAARAVDSREPPIPTISDGQHASAIEQTGDALVSMWRPQRTAVDTRKSMDTIDLLGKCYKVDEQLTVLRLLKQRFAPGFGLWALRLDPRTLALTEFA